MSDQEHAEWLEWRRGGLGASDIAAASTGRYGGAYKVVASKIDGLEQATTPQMDRGNRWEERIADAVHLFTGLHVVGEQALVEHPNRPEWRATVDGFAAPRAEVTFDEVTHVVEIKTAGTNVKPAWNYYHDQIQWQLLVTGLDAAILALGVIDDTDDTLDSLRIRTVDADPDWQAWLIEIAEDLAEHIRNGTYPEIEDPETLDLIKARWPEADGSTVDLDHIADDLARFGKIKQAEKEVADERKVLEARIRDALGPATKGTADGWTVSLSKPARVFTDDSRAAFLQAHPGCVREVFDTDAAKTIDPDLYEALREAKGARLLTRPKETSQ